MKEEARRKSRHQVFPSLTLLNPEEGGKTLRNVSFKILQGENIDTKYSFVVSSILFIFGLSSIRSYDNMFKMILRGLFTSKIESYYSKLPIIRTNGVERRRG